MCYFGPGYQDMLTVLHELGHYGAMLINEGFDGSMDIAETHSQGNEYLFLSYLYTKRHSATYDVLIKYGGYGSLIDDPNSVFVQGWPTFARTARVLVPSDGRMTRANITTPTPPIQFDEVL